MIVGIAGCAQDNAYTRKQFPIKENFLVGGKSLGLGWGFFSETGKCRDVTGK